MNIPKHVAVIMDGNGRWATKKFLPRIVGHSKGVEAARNLVTICLKYNIKNLSLFAFSTENWNRPEFEIKALMHLFNKLLQEEINNLHNNQIKLTVIGDISKLPEELINSITYATNITVNNDRLNLNIAINYGGKWDLVEAIKKIGQEIKTGNIAIEDIKEQYVAKYLSLSNLPDPDLFIRTSGEQRLSNFFLWQTAYTELYFTDTLWPDFGDNDFKQALDFFNSRIRKFGSVIQETERLKEIRHA